MEINEQSEKVDQCFPEEKRDQREDLKKTPKKKMISFYKHMYIYPYWFL